ncbi:MAG: hypothetical protein ACYC7E_03345 [Armatimonadota bacterium]
MGAWFTFRYDSPDYVMHDMEWHKRKAISSAHLEDLFELEDKYVRKWQVNASFVREYATKGNSAFFKRLVRGKYTVQHIVARVRTLIKKHILNDPLAWTHDTYRGPSEPFPPGELKRWASRWATLLGKMGDDELFSVLENNADQVASVISELKAMVDFSVRAERDGVNVVMDVRY